MVVNCFNPNNNSSNNGWGTSSSKMLYAWCTQEIQSMIHVWKSNNMFEQGDISPEHIINEFGLQLCKTIYEGEDNPIVWKTTPSRKNSNLGEFITVNISKPQLPPLGSAVSTVSTYKAENTPPITISSVAPNKRDDFFSDLVNDFTSIDGTASFQMNLRSFLLHVIIFKSHENFSQENYETKSMGVMKQKGIFKSLQYGNWFRSSQSFRDFIKNTKRQINRFSLAQKSLLASKCHTYTIHDSAYGLHEDQPQDISALTKFCFKGTNANIFELITLKYREYLETLK